MIQFSDHVTICLQSCVFFLSLTLRHLYISYKIIITKFYPIFKYFTRYLYLISFFSHHLHSFFDWFILVIWFLSNSFSTSPNSVWSFTENIKKKQKNLQEEKKKKLFYILHMCRNIFVLSKRFYPVP